MNFKKENGFALSDTAIAIIIIMIFTGIIVSIAYNIYLQSNFIKRNDTATNYIVELFEYAKSIDFNEITFAKLSGHFNNISVIAVENDNNTVNKGYTMIIGIDELTEGNNINEIYRKRITAEVRYKLGEKTKTVTMSTIINK